MSTSICLLEGGYMGRTQTVIPVNRRPVATRLRENKNLTLSTFV
jgi:hypothetical protein